jgi:hypothetical protein
MISAKIIDMELSLLLVKYGEEKVIRSLSALLALDIAELESKLQDNYQIIKTKICPKTLNKSNKIERIIDKYPQKKDLMKILYARFQERTFLPHLRDIKDLFNRYNVDSKNLKSRKTATLHVLNFLANLDVKDLEELTQLRDRNNYSSLGIISDEILRIKE